MRSVERAIHTALGYLEALAGGVQSLEDDGDAEKTYLALWALAYGDAVSAQQSALDLLTDPSVEKRFVATHFLTQLVLRRSLLGLTQALGDQDVRVAALAADGMQGGPWETYRVTDAFEQVEAALPRFPKKRQTLAAPVWPWLKVQVEQNSVARLLQQNLFDRSAARLIPYLPLMDSYERAKAVALIERLPPEDPARRATLLMLVGDANDAVRGKVVEALSKTRVTQRKCVYLKIC